ncbi:ornithine cyclodeaminase family protein [Methanopyrus kandleri]|uniref:Predicted ornithine cyclodeaminase, mu-crystallin homolog n=2 Tax=Methanopyrus kandleri TaxID=2320 RepID=Q8TVH8_METKA|nr:ornithine cyclodeaminase family protein [Methanopyrus kandleri]AAM02624.1 Predicted ornithine cyclodeaminase, mu-crystallin homolog [Methanopyrus kandleri AV19]HII70260.1 ornithine cyclodeaminase family protein [Methanopyrus kandleri]
MLFLSEDHVRALLDVREVVERVEETFRIKPECEMPPKTIVPLEGGDFRVMPAYLSELGVAGVKIVNSHPDNPDRGLPTVMAVMCLIEPETGRPLCLVSATEITSLRTGAAGAVASKYLAEDVRTVGIVGAGVQGRYQLLTHAEVFDLEAVFVYDQAREAARRLAEWVERDLGVDAKVLDNLDFSGLDVDVVCTCTPATEPYLGSEDVPEDVHVNAIGADAPEKQEVKTELLKRAVVVVDDREQCVESGDVSQPVERGELNPEELIELSDVVRGETEVDSSELTVFDSTGIAILDVAVGALAYERAKKTDAGVEVKPFELPTGNFK